MLTWSSSSSASSNWTAVYQSAAATRPRRSGERTLHRPAAERPDDTLRGRWDDALAVAEFSLREPDGGYVEHACRSVRAWIGSPAAIGRARRGFRGSALAFARRAKDWAALCQGLAPRARVLAEAGMSDEAAPVIAEALAQSA